MADSTPLSFPAAGLSVAPADGWVRQPDSDYFCLCVLEKRVEGKVVGRFEIISVHPDELLNAKKASSSPLKIGTIEAWEVKKWKTTDKKVSNLAAVFEYAGNTWLAAGWYSGDAGINDLSAIVHSIATTARTSLKESIKENPTANPLLKQSNLVFSPPDPIRPFTPAWKPGKLCFALTNCEAPEDDSLYIWISKVGGAKSKADMQNAVANVLDNTLKASYEITFRTLKRTTLPEVMISTSVALPEATHKGRKLIFVLARDSEPEGAMLVIEFQESDEECAKKVAGIIAESIRKDPSAFPSVDK